MTSVRAEKIAVVTWAVNHNPIGRAHVLAELLTPTFDVEIIGFEFPAYGRGVWPPVRDGSIPVKRHPGSNFPEQLERMEDVARTIEADAVLVSKPRLPGVSTAALAKQQRGCGVVIDVDDLELSFVNATSSVDVHDAEAIRGDETLLIPYGRVWTQVCDPLVGEADGVTVSNAELQRRFGGTVIPHARNEHLFDPQRFDRAAVRSRFGIDPDVRVLLFGGTPRRHKGVLALAEAIVDLGDTSLVLGLIATPELNVVQRDLDRCGCPVITIPPLPFHDMPALLAAADITAVLQDPASPISAHQMPAKVTDALAMQIPCIVNPVPPLAPLIEGGCLEPVGPDGLTATLKRLLDDFGEAQRRARRNREVFLERFSHAAVSPVLIDVVRSAMESPLRLRQGLGQLLAVQRSMFGSQTRIDQVARRGPRATVSRTGMSRHCAPQVLGGPFDLVVFWKQNDSGLYGRRSDLLVNEVARSDHVAQTIHFDAPMGIEALRRTGHSDGIDHHPLVFDTTIRRVLGEANEPNFSRYTFLFDDRGDRIDLPRRDQFGDFVAELLSAHEVGGRDVVFWLYPTGPDLPMLIDRFRPHVVVADVVDDHRTWYPAQADNIRRLTDNYAAVLSRSDFVLANCVAVRDAMSEFHSNVEVLLNACEPPTPSGSLPKRRPPEDLAVLHGPVIGYVGNLSSRIDVPLIDYIALSRPDWNIVLIGSAHAGQDVLGTARHPNVKILGPRRYEDAKRYIRAFDVAIIPHVDNTMTRSMHPLKAFVYCSLGVPVVSTELANLDELREMMTVATDPPSFVEAIEHALRRGRRPLSRRQVETLRAHSWPVRAERALQLIANARQAAHMSNRPNSRVRSGG
jgi:glycosyltransferase involved in cell wall biosynthesis